MVSTKDLSIQILNELSVRENNPYKKNAYRKASATLSQLLEEDFNIRSSFLDLPGIGNSINQKLIEVKTKGSCEYLNSLRVSETTDLYKVRKSFITKRIQYKEAISKANYIIKTLQAHFPIKLTIAGSLRREKALIGDLDIIAETDQETFNKATEFLSNIYTELVRGEYKASYIIDKGTNTQLDLILTTKEEAPFQLLYLTGSQEFNIKMRARAKALGYKLNQRGLSLRDGSTVKFSFNSEESIFRFLGYNYVTPNNR